jgi:hypothetical protein
MGNRTARNTGIPGTGAEAVGSEEKMILWVDGRLPRFVSREINRHGKPIYYFRREHGRRMRLPDISNERFMEIYKSILMDGEDYDYHAENPRSNPERRIEAETLIVVRRTMKSIRARCTGKNLPFDLTVEFLANLAKEQNYRCALTGMKFKLKKEGPFRVDPYALTVDRIIPKRGYVQGNVRLICFAMNLALMNWGEDVFAPFAIAFTQQHFKKKARTELRECGTDQKHAFPVPTTRYGE